MTMMTKDVRYGRLVAAALTMADCTVDELATVRALTPWRHAIWNICRTAGWSYPQIGALAGADHTTVMSACRKTPDRLITVRLYAAGWLTPTQRRALAAAVDGPLVRTNTTGPGTIAASTADSLMRFGLIALADDGYVLDSDGLLAVETIERFPYRRRYECGTRGAYAIDQCRCTPCTQVGRAYENRREKDIGYGRRRTMDAGPVRSHVKKLMAQGMGLKRIAQVSGVSTSAIGKLIYGSPSEGNPRSATVRTSTARALLAVEFDPAGGAVIDSADTMRLIAEMKQAGFTGVQLGRLVTGNPQAHALQVGKRGHVSARNARRVAEAHRAWLDGDLAPDRTPAKPKTPMAEVVSISPDGIRRTVCEECGGPPLAGGRWCLPCFQQRANPRPTGCGTAAGYARHRRAGTTPCTRCKEAHGLDAQLRVERSRRTA